MSRSRFKRKESARSEKPIIYIFTEGLNTEADYFNSIKRDKKCRTVNIVINDGGVGGKCTSGLVNAAIEYVDQNGVNLSKDEVWVVFDLDSFIDTFDNAISQAIARGFKVAYSVVSFELWYVLHYEDYGSAGGKCDYEQILNKHVKGGYSKEKKCTEKMYSLIKDKECLAIARAKRLEGLHVGVRGISKKNPSTTVCGLVERLNLLESS
jgi:hypothetical protein